ncbi:MAG: hypothetical protein JKY95_09650 [Planctomycetaceae bacterium]|nr:hypothetical protein [Planctomycetaceae bacterium]
MQSIAKSVQKSLLTRAHKAESKSLPQAETHHNGQESRMQVINYAIMGNIPISPEVFKTGEPESTPASTPLFIKHEL